MMKLVFVSLKTVVFYFRINIYLKLIEFVIYVAFLVRKYADIIASSSLSQYFSKTFIILSKVLIRSKWFKYMAIAGY